MYCWFNRQGERRHRTSSDLWLGQRWHSVQALRRPPTEPSANRKLAWTVTPCTTTFYSTIFCSVPSVVFCSVSLFYSLISVPLGSTNWCINWVLMRVIDAVRETIADVSSVSPSLERIWSIHSDEGLTLEWPAGVSLTASTTLINTQLITPVCLMLRWHGYSTYVVVLWRAGITPLGSILLWSVLTARCSYRDTHHPMLFPVDLCGLLSNVPHSPGTVSHQTLCYLQHVGGKHAETCTVVNPKRTRRRLYPAHSAKQNYENYSSDWWNIHKSVLLPYFHSRIGRIGN